MATEMVPDEESLEYSGHDKYVLEGCNGGNLWNGIWIKMAPIDNRGLAETIAFCGCDGIPEL